MAELTTLARPYAKAAFQVALQDSALDAWSKMLNTSASVTSNESISSLLTDPSLSSEQLATAFIAVCGDELDEKGNNFVRLLAENKRVLLLPAISEQFHALKANQEKTLDVEVTTAFELSSEILEKLAKSLKTRLQRDINLNTNIDQSLLGGAIIRMDDTVIDSSVRGKLVKLAESMNS
jgi:F-type H+-transporting ATPase subunit delta|tara:strand:- start:1232 stop:1768 length:537 start_codon:yes stop_codon:yes gene_type:complete